MTKVTVIGAGLAGSEAAWQLAQRGIQVELVEMKPLKKSPAHHSDDFAELVCSKSLRGDRLENAVGLLKEELRRLDSIILQCADATRVEAGGCLAVDRHGFSALVTELAGRGWRAYDSGVANAATLVKEGGEVRWMTMQCVDAGTSASVVLQLRRSSC